MNRQQVQFIRGAMRKLRHVIERCSKDPSLGSANEKLGRRRVGKYIVVVSIVAEVDEGFAAPLSSHASQGSQVNNASHPNKDTQKNNGTPTKQPTTEPDYSIKTRHHNKHRANRWHKPIF